jgi:hypothetical protein
MGRAAARRLLRLAAIDRRMAVNVPIAATASGRWRRHGTAARRALRQAFDLVLNRHETLNVARVSLGGT